MLFYLLKNSFFLNGCGCAKEGETCQSTVECCKGLSCNGRGACEKNE